MASWILPLYAQFEYLIPYPTVEELLLLTLNFALLLHRWTGHQQRTTHYGKSYLVLRARILIVSSIPLFLQPSTNCLLRESTVSLLNLTQFTHTQVISFSFMVICRADHFNVSLPFLLQQAAWLYDRQLSQVRAQIRRVGTKSSLRPASSGSVAARPSSGGGGMVNAHNSNENLTISKVRAAAAPSPTTTGGVNTRRNVSSGSSASLLLRNATANRGAVELKSGGRPGTPGSAGVMSTSPQQQQQQQQQATIHPPQPPPLETRPSFLDAPSDVEEEGSTEFPSESDRIDGNVDSQRHAASAAATATASSKHKEPEIGMRKLRHFDMLSQSRPRMRMSYANSRNRRDYISIRDDDEENQPAFLPHSDNYDDSNDEEDDEEEVPSLTVYDDSNATILGSSEQRPGNQEERQQQQQQRNLTIDTALTTTSVTAEHNLSTASTTTSNSMSTIPDLSAANSTGSMGLDQRRATTTAAAATTDTGHPANESMSPRSRTRMVVREEMDGVNSTGSSFSDLDGERFF